MTHRLAYLPVLALALMAAPAHAQTARVTTFVSAQRGNDANATNGGNCNPANPCRTFAAAISVVRAGGEVVALDSGGYGPVTINKSVTLTGPSGTYVGITAQTGDGITVAAGGTDVVTVKGLTIKYIGSPATVYGINFVSGARLHISDCTIEGFHGDGAGIFVQSSSNASGGTIFIRNTTVKENGTGVSFSNATGDMDHLIADGNGIGIAAFNAAKITAKHTVASGNGVGFFSTGGSLIVIEESTASGNNTGASAQGGSVIVSGSVISNNVSWGLSNVGGKVASRGNNTVYGNDNYGAISNLPPM